MPHRPARRYPTAARVRPEDTWAEARALLPSSYWYYPTQRSQLAVRTKEAQQERRIQRLGVGARGSPHSGSSTCTSSAGTDGETSTLAIELDAQPKKSAVLKAWLYEHACNDIR